MDYSYNKIVDGYKKSLQYLKKLDVKAYNEYVEFFKRFEQKDIQEFFKTINDRFVNNTIPNSKNVLQVRDKKDGIVSCISLYYGISFDLKIEYFDSSDNENYVKYTLCPLVYDMKEHGEGVGEIFFKATRFNSGEQNKIYYSIVKKQNYYEMKMQSNTNNILKRISIEKLPEENSIII